MLLEYFKKNNESAILTSEPTNGPVGQIIRLGMAKRLNFSANSENFDKQMAYLFAADRFDHLYNDTNGIINSLAHSHVISTRYYFSSYAYHCKLGEYDFVKKLNEFFPEPDYLIYLDISPKDAVKRLAQRVYTEAYETEEKLSRVRMVYNDIFKKYTNRIILLDATHPMHKIHEEIVQFVTS